MGFVASAFVILVRTKFFKKQIKPYGLTRTTVLMESNSRCAYQWPKKKWKTNEKKRVQWLVLFKVWELEKLITKIKQKSENSPIDPKKRFFKQNLHRPGGQVEFWAFELLPDISAFRMTKTDNDRIKTIPTEVPGIDLCIEVIWRRIVHHQVN